MTRLAAIHPKCASRDERLGNDQASAAGEVHADDTKMVAHGGTGQKARTAADPAWSAALAVDIVGFQKPAPPTMII
jgi:hypothetical protein